MALVDACPPATGFHLGPEPGDIAAAASRAAAAVVGRFGVVGDCFAVPGAERAAGIHIHAARGPRRLPGRRFVEPPVGTGVSMDPAEARLAAIAETVERYAVMAPPPSGLLTRAAFAELGAGAVPPASFALLSAAQYRRFPQLTPAGAAREIDWCPAFSLTHRRPALIPAALAYLACARRPPNDFVAEVTSTGTACHVSLPQAVVSGLCEVLERDALTIAWQNRLAMTRLVAEPGGAAAALIAALEGPVAELIELYEVPTPAPFPVVLAVAWNPSAHPHAAVGAACRPDHAGAARRAVLEVVQVLSRLRMRGAGRPRRVRTYDDHADLYATVEGAGLLRRMLAGGPAASLPEPPSEPPRPLAEVLARAVAGLHRDGLEVLVTELTTADLAGTGFRVIRVVVPGAVDMTPDARCPRLGGERLYSVPVRLGLRTEPLAEAAVNRLPVPLA